MEESLKLWIKADTIECLLRNVDHSVDSDDYGEEHKVAVALDSDEKMVGKLATAKKFVLAATKGRKILERTGIEVKPDEDAVEVLKKAGVDTLICSGIDRKLRGILEQNDIADVPVMKSSVEDVLANFLDGRYNKA